MTKPRAAFLMLMLAIAGVPCFAAAEDSLRANAAKVEAAFLRNFAHYVTWPEQAFASEHSPWRICVLGGDPFGNTLDETFQGRTEQGRPFEIVRAEASTDIATCQIVYVAYRTSASRRTALAELVNRPVLTVGDAPEFLQEGGMIRFLVSDHVEFGVNLDRTRSASLKMQTRLLEVAREVVENGVARSRK
jgi:hypothetical protein